MSITHHTWNTWQQRLIHLRFNDLEAFSLAYPVKPVSGEPVKPGKKKCCVGAEVGD